MANTLIQLKRSSVPGKVPNTSTLSTGELAINLADNKLFTSNGTAIFELNANNANNSSYLGGTAAASYVQNTESRTLSGNLVFSSAITTFNNNVEISGTINAASYTSGSGFIANSTALISTGFANVATSVNSALFTVGSNFTANATLVNAAAINITNQANAATFYATTSANVGTLVQANTSAYIVSSNSTVNTVITATSITQSNTTAVPLVANVTGVYHTGVINAASHTSGSGFIANSTAIVSTGFANVATSVNSALFTVGSTFTANATLVNAAAINITGQVNTATLFTSGNATIAAIVANSTIGTNGQALLSNGTGIYWAAVTAEAVVNLDAQYVWTNTHTFQNTITFNSNVDIGSYLTLGNNSPEGGQVNFYNPDGTTFGMYIDVSSADNGRIFSVSNNFVLQIGQFAGTNGSIGFYTSAAERMSIGSTGNILIANSVNAASYTTTNFSANSSLVNAQAINIVDQVNTGTMYVSTSANIASVTLANATGVYTTGTVNAATHTSGSGFTANSTMITAPAIDAIGQIDTFLGANAIALSNATSNWIYYNTAGVAAPTVTTRSAGTKIVLYPLLSATTTDFAIGITGSTLWQSVPNLTSKFSWYANTTEIMIANTTGLYVNSSIVMTAASTLKVYYANNFQAFP